MNALIFRLHLLSLTLFCICYSASTAQPRAPQQDQIVALGGSITEIIYALGEQHKLVGVDQTSIYPHEATQLEQVGYFRNVSAEGILSLNPTTVFALEGAGPQTALDQLKAAGVALHIIPNTQTPEGAKDKIRSIAALLDDIDHGEQLIKKLESDLQYAKSMRPDIMDEARVLFVYARGSGSMNIAGKETAADAIIHLAGGDNVVTEYTNYRPMSAEAVVASSPDVILMLDHGLSSIGGIDAFLKTPGVALTPAGKNRRIISMDDMLVLGFGPRLGQAVLELQSLLYDSAP